MLRCLIDFIVADGFLFAEKLVQSTKWAQEFLSERSLEFLSVSFSARSGQKRFMLVGSDTVSYQTRQGEAAGSFTLVESRCVFVR